MQTIKTSDAVLIREWDSDLFHKKVADLELEGYRARRETYNVVAEMDPETGSIIHLYGIEMDKEN